MICMETIGQFYMTEPTVLTIGKFDGLHRGHAKLLDELRKRQAQGMRAVAFTFDIPPKRLTEGKTEGLLSTNAEKNRLFEEKGLDYLIRCPFTPEIMHMEPEDFVEWIVAHLNVKSIVIGTDCRFGHDRRGDHRLLQQLAGRYGYELCVVEKLQFEGRDISSTFIREEITKGNMEIAMQLLGHAYSIDGIVQYGNQLGRTIGAPTVNILAEPDKLLPPFGVYAASVELDGELFFGIADVGRKPTVRAQEGTENPIAVETHIFDFDRDIYGREVRTYFYSYLRPEIRFDSILDLQSQIKKDIVSSERFFNTTYQALKTSEM